MTYRQPFKGDYIITQFFGEKITDPKGHTGIDYGCPLKTEILASADGEVIFAGWDNTGYGNLVTIRHVDGNTTFYAHLYSVRVQRGQKVKQSDVIGLSGWTGTVIPSGPGGAHLHFEVRGKDGKAFDPMTLPMMSMDDNFADTSQNFAHTSHLKEPDQLGELVKVVCTDGANAFKPDWTYKLYGFPQGTPLHFTGKTAKRPGFPEYTYCEVYEEPRKYWVAVHDGTTQILDNSK